MTFERFLDLSRKLSAGRENSVRVRKSPTKKAAGLRECSRLGYLRLSVAPVPLISPAKPYLKVACLKDIAFKCLGRSIVLLQSRDVSTERTVSKMGDVVNNL